MRLLDDGIIYIHPSLGYIKSGVGELDVLWRYEKINTLLYIRFTTLCTCVHLAHPRAPPPCIIIIFFGALRTLLRPPFGLQRY